MIGAILALSSAIAAQPAWAGGGKGEKDEQKGKHEKYFSDQHRVIVRDYYHEEFRAGRCPPGLAKKGNGCMPPGQAKKWAVGRPLPRDVIFYDVPRELVVQIGARRPDTLAVANDILLIMVGWDGVDAIQDLGRRKEYPSLQLDHNRVMIGGGPRARHIGHWFTDGA